MFVCFFFHFVNTCWHVLCVFCTLGSNLPESPWCENSPGASESHFDLTWPCFFLSTCFRTQMLAAAQSPPPSPRPPPPPPPLGPQSRPPPPGSAAHRRLEADRCYSSSPRQRRRREHRGSTPRVSVWHLKKNHISNPFLQPRATRLVKDPGERRVSRRISGICIPALLSTSLSLLSPPDQPLRFSPHSGLFHPA